MSTQKVLQEVALERTRQDGKWGVQRHDDDRWHRILSEEVGEVAMAIGEGDQAGQRQELLQVAAVAVATIEALDDRGNYSTRRRLAPLQAYLAGPIAGCSDEEAHGWRELFKMLYPHARDPMARDYRRREISLQDVVDIVEGDKRDIDHCDVVVVHYVRPSVGTSMEVIYAHERGKKVLVINAQAGPLSPWIQYHSHFIVETVAEAAALIERLNGPADLPEEVRS